MCASAVLAAGSHRPSTSGTRSVPVEASAAAGHASTRRPNRRKARKTIPGFFVFTERLRRESNPLSHSAMEKRIRRSFGRHDPSSAAMKACRLSFNRITSSRNRIARHWVHAHSDTEYARLPLITSYATDSPSSGGARPPQSSSTRTYVRICFDGLRTNRERRRVSAPWIVRSVGFWCSPVRACCSSAVSRRVRGAVAGVCRRGVCERGFGLFARASHVEHLFDFGFGVVSDGVCLCPSMMGFVFGSLDRPFVGWRDRACCL